MGSSIRQSATLVVRLYGLLLPVGRDLILRRDLAVAVQLASVSVLAIAAILAALRRACPAAERSPVYVKPLLRHEDHTEAALDAKRTEAAASIRGPHPRALAFSDRGGVVLPKGATDAELRMMLGSAGMMLSFLLLMLRRLGIGKAS